MPHVYGSHYGLIRTIKAFNQLTVFPTSAPPKSPKQQFNQLYKQQRTKFAAVYLVVITLLKQIPGEEEYLFAR